MKQALLPTDVTSSIVSPQAVPEKTNEDDEQDATIRTGNLLRTLTGPELSIAVGASILLAVLTNRLVMPELVDSQARTDILGIIASGGLITNGVYMLVRKFSTCILIV